MERAGKRRSNRLRKGDPWLETALIRCARAATRKKGSHLQARFPRLRRRREPKKAVCAAAGSMLAAACHMLRDGTFYKDLGPDHFQRTSPESRANRLARQIQKLGFACTIGPAKPEGVSIELLGHTGDANSRIVVEPYLITLTNGSYVFPLVQHAGSELPYMLEGEAVYRHGDASCLMTPGDSLFFDADAPHGPEEMRKLPIRFPSGISYPREG